jgi:UDP-glucose 4-epimerase
MPKAIVVTGSQGFVGKHLRRALEARGCEVIGVDRPGTGAEIEQDLSDPQFDADAFAQRCQGVDGVIYMAATITRGSSVDALARSNLRAIVDAGVELFDAMQATSPAAHFVYCSTYKTYGPAEAVIDPARPPQRPDPHSYGSAKSLAERLLAVAAARSGARYAIVRPTCIYGPGQHPQNAIPVFLRSLLAGEAPVVFGTGRDVRDDVYAPDLAYCLAEACLRGTTGALHAAGERSRTIMEVAELCCEVFAEWKGQPRKTPVLDGSKPAKWWLDQVFELAPTRAALAYAPTPLREGLLAEARWLEAGADPRRSIEFSDESEVGSR